MRRLAYCTVAGILLVSAGFAVGANEPTVSPPQGTTLLLKVIADGVQIYTCEAKDNGFKWTFEGPEASLFDEHGRQEGTHFGGPTWKLATVRRSWARSSRRQTRRNLANPLAPAPGDEP